MTNVFNLEAKRHESSVLASYIAGREGGAQRAGVQAAAQNTTVTNLNAETLAGILGLASSSAAGVAVTPESAMRVSTVYACVAKLSGAIASLPFAVFERDGEAKKPADHPYWWMLNEEANADMTASTAWKMLISGQLFYGDGYAQLLRPRFSSSKVTGWRPIHPLRVQPFWGNDGAVYYRIQPRNGGAYVLHSADMIHLPSLGYDEDTLMSPSPITCAAREQIGTAIAAETYSAKFFSEGATFDYALKTAANLNRDQLETLKASLLARRGSVGTRSPMILTGGLEPAQLSVNAKDAEILATRLFGVEEICRIFGVPPHIVGHTEKNSSWGTGMAEQGGNYVRYTLSDRLTDIRQEFNRKLWPIREKYFVEHKTEALERGDLTARNDAYRISLGRAGEPGWMSINEIRRLENMPPVEGGDDVSKGITNAQPPDQTAG
jgi:HK97 family phage portal protein